MLSTEVLWGGSHLTASSPAISRRLCTTTTTTLHTSNKLECEGRAHQPTRRRACYFTTSTTHTQPFDAAEQEEASTEAAVFPTLSDILVVANERGVKLEVKNFGPFFKIRAWSVEGKEELGSANGMIRLWVEGRILHLESIRMLKASEKMARMVFGLALLIGAATIRYGYDRKCVKAELLAIKDDDLTHAKLMRYYKRMGFKPMYEVTGESLKDVPHILVWGGIGTRMDAQLPYLLQKWSKAFILN